MRVLTYRDPFRMGHLFDVVGHDAVHLCVSDTLRQGLLAYYGAETFAFIATVESVLQQLFPEWYAYLQRRVQQFHSLSQVIRAMGPSAQSLLGERRELVEAFRLLRELNVSPLAFKSAAVSHSERLVARVYEAVAADPVWSPPAFERLNKASVQSAFHMAAKAYLSDVRSGATPGLRKQLKSFLHTNRRRITSVVLHGVHQFMPEVVNLVKGLERVGFQVTMAYLRPKLWRHAWDTWDEVYKWTGVSAEDVDAADVVTLCTDLGHRLGKVIDGDGSVFQQNADGIEFISYADITEFCDHVSDVYSQGDVEAETSRSRLGSMSEQFYAVDNNRANELLRQYHPEHFGNRHFLSYPLGKVIMILHLGWDVDKHSAVLSASEIRTCLMSGFFGNQQDGNDVIAVFEKLAGTAYGKLTLEEWRARFEHILLRIQQLANHVDGQLLRSVAPYSVSEAEVSGVINAIQGIIDLAKIIFAPGSGYEVDLRQHLDRVVSAADSLGREGNIADQEELEIINELVDRFEQTRQLRLNCHVSDIAEFLHYYLAVKKDERSTWLVRNFEQLDGAVYLDHVKRERKNRLHIADLSDQSLAKSKTLPWPLTIELLERLPRQDALSAMLTSLREYGAFLRCSLLYALAFAQSSGGSTPWLTLSYWEESETGERMTPYWLLLLMGLEPVAAKPVLRGTVRTEQVPAVIRRQRANGSCENLCDNAVRDWLYCKQRFLFHTACTYGEPFANPFHVHRWYGNYVEFSYLRDMPQPLPDKEELWLAVADHAESIRAEWFPFIMRTESIHWVRRAFRRIQSNMAQGDLNHLRLRLEFLTGRVTECDSNDNLMAAVHRLPVNANGNRRNILADEIATWLQVGVEDPRQVPTDKHALCRYCPMTDLCLVSRTNGASNDGE